MKDAIAHLRQADPVMAGIVDRVGACLIATREPTFETLARSITFQQLSGKAAATIFGRLKKAVGRRFTATAFLRLSDEELRACGLSRQKIASLKDLAEHVADRRINFKKLADMTDEEVIAALSQIRGVGVWTVQMFLIFALKRPNVMPFGDLGVRTAIQKAYGLTGVPKPAELLEITKSWHPYCSFATWYLWRSLDASAEV
ncbi:MAG TPA: DNA-3-methyladenine glycosylase [Bryobacteraceae bacterium]|jgi:DNA-3-methyladenine glycosylase II|nr:DNA-3-methyladenine glycosylase [Bryobacteraceae bacterium]